MKYVADPKNSAAHRPNKNKIHRDNKNKNEKNSGSTPMLDTNSPLMEEGGGTLLDLVSAAISPQDLHLETSTVAARELKNTVSQIDSKASTQM